MTETRVSRKLPGSLAVLRRRLAYEARARVNRYPLLYRPVARWQHRGNPERALAPDTELVIEGFPRSGNTFATAAFRLSQRRPVKFAHHTHAPAQVIAAVRRRIPTLVVVRPPVPTISSHIIRSGVPARACLANWVAFHERILGVRDGVVIGSFETVTQDYGSVIRAVNAKFGTSFDEFEHTPGNEERVFERIVAVHERRADRSHAVDRATAIARPTADRDDRKRAAREQLVGDPGLARTLARAEELYRELVPVDAAPERGAVAS
jgi:hypothetical protein